MKAMVLAAGFGKRLSPLTDTLPKPLIKVGDQSLIQRNINYLIDNGFSEIIINVSHHSDQVINHVKEIFPNINILFSIEDKPLGTGGGILKALPIIGTKPFLLINSDIFHNIDIKDLPQDTKAAHLIGVPNPEHNADGDFSLKKDLIEIITSSAKTKAAIVEQDEREGGIRAILNYGHIIVNGLLIKSENITTYSGGTVTVN